MIFTESGITINLPESYLPFRFEDCPAYVGINSQSVTEMDVCWLQNHNGRNTLWLVELKQLFDVANPRFREVDISADEVYNEYIEKFYRNVWHSVSMLAQNRSGTQACSRFPASFNFEYASIKILFILNLKPEFEQYVNLFGIDLKKKLMDAQAIFRLDSIVVLSYNQAKMLFPSIVT